MRNPSTVAEPSNEESDPHDNNEKMVFQRVYEQVLNNAGSHSSFDNGSNKGNGRAAHHSTHHKQQQKHQRANITEYTVKDILSGRGGLGNKHAGNRVYRRLIDMNKPLYAKLKTKTRKSQLVESILTAISNKGGRFLKQDENTKHWFEIDYKEAAKKTSQALREPDRTKGNKKQTAGGRSSSSSSPKSTGSSSDNENTDNDGQQHNSIHHDGEDGGENTDNDGHQNSSHRDGEDGGELSDEAMDSLFHAPLSVFRATTKDLFPEAASAMMMVDSHPSTSTTNHYHGSPHDRYHTAAHHRYTASAPTASTHLSFGTPTTGDLFLDEPASSTTIKAADYGLSPASLLRLTSATYQHNHHHGNNDHNDGSDNHYSIRESLSFPPPPEWLLRSNTSRAFHHNIDHNMMDLSPGAPESLNRLHSSSFFFPPAMDSVLFRQDSLDLSSGFAIAAAAAAAAEPHSSNDANSPPTRNTEQHE